MYAAASRPVGCPTCGLRTCTYVSYSLPEAPCTPTWAIEVRTHTLHGRNWATLPSGPIPLQLPQEEWGAMPSTVSCELEAGGAVWRWRGPSRSVGFRPPLIDSGYPAARRYVRTYVRMCVCVRVIACHAPLRHGAGERYASPRPAPTAAGDSRGCRATPPIAGPRSRAEAYVGTTAGSHGFDTSFFGLVFLKLCAAQESARGREEDRHCIPRLDRQGVTDIAVEAWRSIDHTRVRRSGIACGQHE